MFLERNTMFFQNCTIMFHSDRGTQYTASAILLLPQIHHIQPSLHMRINATRDTSLCEVPLVSHLFSRLHDYCLPSCYRYSLPILGQSLYAKAAVMIAMEYTSLALQPLERSLIGAFSPRRIGPYASKFPSL